MAELPKINMNPTEDKKHVGPESRFQGSDRTQSLIQRYGDERGDPRENLYYGEPEFGSFKTKRLYNEFFINPEAGREYELLPVSLNRRGANRTSLGDQIN